LSSVGGERLALEVIGTAPTPSGSRI